ncbi:MAG TPA: HAMP domain-containing sensor histidine kinase [Burkholderiales bacterium]|nr:HAMP domain-containing sensor histidine kinase [Burkholderiales bacterium]
MIKEDRGLEPLGALSKIMNVGVLLLGPSGALEFANPVASELLGCAGEQELKARWNELKRLMGLDGTPAGGSGPARRVADVPLGGAVRSLRLEIHPLGEECPACLVLLKDRRTVDMLETDLLLASQMRSLVHVYRVMAHDLKAPLNSMQLTLELLADSVADEDRSGAVTHTGSRERRHRHIAILREELARLNRILQSMLDQKEPLGTVPHAFDLRELIREIARLLIPLARRQRVEIDLQMPDSEVKVSGYRDRLKQALLNVAVHRLEAMPGGGRLAIRVAMQDACPAVVTIEDTGTGMPEGLLDEIYQNHFTRKKSGSGLGIYVARLVVESHGGELVAESGRSAGMCFRLTLPPTGRTAPGTA